MDERVVVRKTVVRDPLAEPVVPAPVGYMDEQAVLVRHRGPWSSAARWVTLGFGILQVLLVLRIILLLLIANRDNSIVAFILGITGPFVAPFADMFAITHVESTTGAVLDVAAFVALIGWSLVEALVLAVLNLAGRDRVITG